MLTCGMSITAIVENDTIKLPPGVHLPDGTKVHIQAEAPKPSTPADGLAWLKKHAGVISGPSDLAAEHDHYARGTPKRSRS